MCGNWDIGSLGQGIVLAASEVAMPVRQMRFGQSPRGDRSVQFRACCAVVEVFTMANSTRTPMRLLRVVVNNISSTALPIGTLRLFMRSG